MADSKTRHLAGSNPIQRTVRFVATANADDQLRVAVLLRRKPYANPLPSIEELCRQPRRDYKAMREKILEDCRASEEDVEAVEKFAAEFNLTIEKEDLEHRVITLTGRAEDFSRAVEVELVWVDHPRGRHRTHRGVIRLPEDLVERVEGVFGLDERPVGRRQAASSLSEKMQTLPLEPAAVAELYDFPPGTGAGESVGIIQLGGGYDPTEMEKYFARLGLAMPKITDVGIAGATNNPGVNVRYDAEVCLDIQVLEALAPDAEMSVYFAPNTGLGFLLALHAAVDGGHSVVSISWSESEYDLNPLIVKAMNDVLHEAATLGVTVCVASGDLGAGGETHPSLPEPYFPATSPFALACGGTSPLFHDARCYDEVVWNEGNLASGGGVSYLFDVPPYQKATRSTIRSLRPGVGYGRGIPDVSGMSYGYDSKWKALVGYMVCTNGDWQALGGTSAATPLWAALILRMNEHLGWSLGFLQPWIYGLTQDDEAFYDVVSGNNANTSSILGGYNAVPGWDACTGWGRPWGRALLTAIERRADSFD